MYFDTVNITLHVRPGDLDINGHVNNARVLEYFEAGRWSWLSKHGLSKQKSSISVVSSIRVVYLHEINYQELLCRTQLHLPESVEVGTWEDELTYKAEIRQILLDKKEESTLATADVSIVFIDRNSRELRSLQEFIHSQKAT